MDSSHPLSEKDKELIELARAASQNAYAPYSRFEVGAALLTVDERIFTGCNVENTSLGLTVCAERTATYAAVCHGSTQFQKLVIVVNQQNPSLPCGACRQVLHEFSPELEILAIGNTGKILRAKLTELLPNAFQYKP
ncbi:MAG: cytidine deaminase [Promethearchaeota archaeon]